MGTGGKNCCVDKTSYNQMGKGPPGAVNKNPSFARGLKQNNYILFLLIICVFNVFNVHFKILLMND